MSQYRNIQTGRLYNLYRCTPAKFTGWWYEMEDIITGEIKRIDDIEIKEDYNPEKAEDDSRLFCPKCGWHIGVAMSPVMDKEGTKHERVTRYWDCSHCGQKGEAIYTLRALVVAKNKKPKRKRKSAK